jgi:hypothetical protein
MEAGRRPVVGPTEDCEGDGDPNDAIGTAKEDRQALGHVRMGGALGRRRRRAADDRRSGACSAASKTIAAEVCRGVVVVRDAEAVRSRVAGAGGRGGDRRRLLVLGWGAEHQAGGAVVGYAWVADWTAGAVDAARPEAGSWTDGDAGSDDEDRTVARKSPTTGHRRGSAGRDHVPGVAQV